MLDVAVINATAWDDNGRAGSWQNNLSRAAEQAVRATPYVTFADSAAVIEIAVRLTDDAEVRTLNHQWRGKDMPTNVLSFPQVQPDLLSTVANTDDGEVLLGDIVLAHETCGAEAADKGITVLAHAVHLVVHGTLHLLGYDHGTDDAAALMEDIETRIVMNLGYADPYKVRGEI